MFWSAGLLVVGVVLVVIRVHLVMIWLCSSVCAGLCWLVLLWYCYYWSAVRACGVYFWTLGKIFTRVDLLFVPVVYTPAVLVCCCCCCCWSGVPVAGFTCCLWYKSYILAHAFTGCVLCQCRKTLQFYCWIVFFEIVFRKH